MGQTIGMEYCMAVLRLSCGLSGNSGGVTRLDENTHCQFLSSPGL